MPTDKPRKPALTCWNCEREAEESVSVTLGAPGRGQTALTLCHACHASSYLPLAAQAGDVTPRTDEVRRVLVVDDDPHIVRMLAATFEGEGYAVDTAAHGLEALHRACQRMPNVVVLDLRMPVMDGHRFIATWRQLATAPIVAISARERQSTAEELGVEAFLPKPFELDALIEAVKSLSRSAGRSAPA